MCCYLNLCEWTLLLMLAVLATFPWWVQLIIR